MATRAALQAIARHHICSAHQKPAHPARSSQRRQAAQACRSDPAKYKRAVAANHDHHEYSWDSDHNRLAQRWKSQHLAAGCHATPASATAQNRFHPEASRRQSHTEIGHIRGSILRWHQVPTRIISRPLSQPQSRRGQGKSRWTCEPRWSAVGFAANQEQTSFQLRSNVGKHPRTRHP